MIIRQSRAAILALAAGLFLSSAADAREISDIRKWEFRFDADSTWREVTIPHDFQMDLPWEKEAGEARGFKRCETGWYRCYLDYNPAWDGKKVYLDFEGIAMQGDIYLNGKVLGEIDYGYLGAEFDMGSRLLKDQPNEILVKAYTGDSDGSRWYTGGGLYRPVHVMVKDSISIARHGLYITTPEVTREKASVRIQVALEGYTNKNLGMDLLAKVYGPDGNVLGEVSCAAPDRNKLDIIETVLPEFTVENPRLWSCEEPNLYRVEVQLCKDGQIIDSVSDRFGIRTIEFDKEFGFKLNGEKVFLKGISNHHDLGALGAAAYEGALERIMKMLKEFGYNHIRCSHNPYSEDLYRLADEYGILVVDELYDKWKTDGGQYWIGHYPFTESWFRHESEWMKRDRNHPCIIMWSFGNETQVDEAWTGFPDTHDWGVTTYYVMKAFGQRFDNTRPFTVAQFPARKGSIQRDDERFYTQVWAPDLACVTDVASINYRYDEYDKYLEHDPDLNIYQSEASTNGLAAPFFGMDEDKMVGLAYWGAIEYWGESNGWPKKGWNYSFFNSALEPYPQAYLIKSAFVDEPIVHIAVSRGKGEQVMWNDIISGRTNMDENWNLEPGSKVGLLVFSNAEEVELIVNGKSLGTKQNNLDDRTERNIFRWSAVDYGKGGSVVAIARNGGKEVARHRIETTGKAVALKAVREDVRGELEFVRFYAVDSRGRIVRNAEPQVSFSLSEGDAELVAIDNQDHYSNELFNVNPKTMKNGFVMAIVRKGSAPVTLEAASKGLRSAKVEIRGL